MLETLKIIAILLGICSAATLLLSAFMTVLGVLFIAFMIAFCIQGIGMIGRKIYYNYKSKFKVHYEQNAKQISND
jgi:hypothetical protein